MPPSKLSNNVNRKRRRKRDAVQKKLRMPESEMRAIHRAGQDVTIMMTTGTGEIAERTTAAGNGHSKMMKNVVVAISDNVMVTVTVILTDNGNVEGGIQVRTMTSGVVTIEKESEKCPWSEPTDIVVANRILQNGSALAAQRVAKNGNVGTATLNILNATIGLTIGLLYATILRTVRVERRQGVSAPQASP